MKDVYVFLPASGNTKAMLALSAVARAMKQMNKVAIVRCVWRWEQANVFIGVLTPNLSVRENIVGFSVSASCIFVLVCSSFLFISCFSDYAVQPDSFYLNVLPFAEDL